MTVQENQFDFAAFDADAVLGWYDQHARELPWRARSPELAPARRWFWHSFAKNRRRAHASFHASFYVAA